MFKTFHNEETIILGKWTKEELDRLLYKSSQIKIVGKRIEFLSRQLIGLDYKESTLIGNINTPEVFVINLEGVDCFTYIDYIEAMRLSRSFSKFKLNLRKIRYKSGKVAFENRNHFFTDWQEFNSDFIQDVTKKIGSKKTVKIQKMLNEKEDGTYLLIGINHAQREIKYIPSDAIDDSVINKIKIGDYVGIYSHLAGLDVSHVGIVVKDRERIFLRPASSQKKYKKAIDQDLKKYK